MSLVKPASSFIGPLATIFLLALPGCSSVSPATPYFEYLCSQEAGEQIYKTVDNVESIFQMRLPAKYDTTTRRPLYDGSKWAGNPPYWSFKGRFWTDDYPANFEVPPRKTLPMKTFRETADAPFTTYVFEGINPNRESSARYIRVRSEHVLVKPCSTYHCYAENEHRQERESTTSLQSRYGYTWTELKPSRFADRIIGAEFKVVDLQTNEVLAVARDYYMFPMYLCERCSSPGGICKKPDGTYRPIEAHTFVTSVLRPASTTPRKRVYEVK